MKTLRFLQFSDLHIGSRFSNKRLGLPVEKQAIREDEVRQMIRRIFETARDQQVDVVLAPGDLWDSEHIAPEHIHHFFECVRLLGDIPLIVTPGNHDYYSQRSYYHPDFLETKGYSPWPDNVMIFSGSEFTTRPLPGRDDVWVTGCAFQGNVTIEEKVLDALSPVAPDPEGFHLLLFHGSRVDTLAASGKALTAPFTLADLQRLQYDYTAVGHYHDLEPFQERSGGRVWGAYSGCVYGRKPKEAGPKGILLGELQKDESGQVQVSLNPVVLDARKISVEPVDVTGYDHLEELREGVLKQLEASPRGLTPQDMVICRLKGVLSAGLVPDVSSLPQYLQGQLEAHFFHVQCHLKDLQVGSGLADFASMAEDNRPEQDLSLEERFCRTLYQEWQATEDEERRQILENALKYGLHALYSQPIEMLYEQ